MLMFNLSSLSGSEEISSAELHFYKRRAVSQRKGRLMLQQNHHHYLQGYALMDDLGDKPERIGQWEVALEKRGWQVYDVTAAFTRPATSPRHIAFNFQGASKVRPLALEQVLRMDPTPFLVVFSNERSNASIATPKDLNALPDQEDGRKRRSIDDNELPEMDHGHYLNSNVIPQTSPGMLQGRGRPASNGKISGAKTGSHSTLPYPKAGSTLDWPAEDKTSSSSGSSSGSKRRTTTTTGSSSSVGGSRKGKRRNRKLPETWHYNQQVYRKRDDDN